MKLTIMERITLLEILPKEGDFTTLKLVRKLRESLSLSEQEIEQIGLLNYWQCPKCHKGDSSKIMPKCPDCDSFMIPTNQVTWDDVKAGDLIKDVHLGNTMMTLCVDTLKKIDTEKKLTQRHYSLYEKFIETKED